MKSKTWSDTKCESCDDENEEHANLCLMADIQSDEEEVSKSELTFDEVQAFLKEIYDELTFDEVTLN